MKYWKILIVLAAVWGGLTIATVGFLAGDRVEDPVRKFYTLQAELEAVSDAVARSEVTADGAAAAPHDPRKRVLHEMDKLARAVIDRPDGAHIARETFAWSYMLELDLPRLPDRFKLLAENHPNAPELLAPLDVLPDAVTLTSDVGVWNEILDDLVQRTDTPEIRLAARYAQGQIRIQTGDLDAAKAAFQHLIEQAPESEAAKFAERAIFEIDHLRVGKTTPDFTATTLDGDEITLKSLRGNVVLLDFWATWCPTCIQEIPRIREVVARLEGKPFKILAVSLDDTKEQVRKLINIYEPPGIQTWDPAGRENPIARMYNAKMLPTWYVIDAEGVIRARDPFGEKLLPAIGAALPSAEASADHRPGRSDAG